MSKLVVTMDKKKFRSYFESKKAKERSRSDQNDNDVIVTGYLSSASNVATPADLSLAEEELEKTIVHQKTKYQTNVSNKIKREVASYAKEFSTQAALKKFRSKYPKLTFNRTTVNNWKKKFERPEALGRKIGRPNMLSDDIIKKVKDIVMGTRIAGGVINRQQVVCIAKGVVKANNPNILKEFGGSVEITDRWARNLLNKIGWIKRKATTGKVAPSPLLLKEEKFSFQREIAQAVHDNDIPRRLIFNIDQTPLTYVTPGKYTFNRKGASNVPIKGVDDKRQITATFCINAAGEFFPMQLIYAGKTKRSQPKYEFPEGFHITQTTNHWSNLEKSTEFFKYILFPTIDRIKKEDRLPTEQDSLVVMDNFRGQDNETIRDFSNDNGCVTKIVPHNMTNWFQPLDLSVNKPAKSFISNKYNEWFSNEVTAQIVNGVDPPNIKVSMKLSDLKPLHARWISELYDHLRSQKDIVLHGFEQAGIMEAIENANDMIISVENPYRA